jgi:hypothetical protein
VPLNSVQLYVRSLLDELQIPGLNVALEAYVTPPMVEDIDRPKAYVMASRGRARRQTAPRGPGFKRIDWTVDVYVTYETVPDSDTIDQEMPLIIDAICTKLWTTTMPLFIEDPTTGLKSQVLQIGEEFDIEYPPERTPATLRMLYYTARLGFDVYEAVQA